MIGVIILTATAASAITLVLSRHDRNYVKHLEQSSLDRADQIEVLEEDCRRYVRRLQNEQLSTRAAVCDGIRYVDERSRV